MAGITVIKNRPLPSGARSNDKAILVLLGLTGAGKTTTLNFLFDRVNMIKTESYCSATSTIMEYNATVNCNGSDYDLRIIDTPGFGDTRQQPQVRDARFVATLDKLLKTDNDLKSCYPTTVLLVAKFNDDRIDGETSHFIQMLKAVDTLLANYRLIDKDAQHPNLIFVLTHAMSEDSKALRSDPTPKIKLIECLVKTFTKLPTPIEVVIAENKPELYDLPKLNDFFKLPNGQYYPLNLFQKIQSMAIKANDVVGETILREYFKNPSQITIQLNKESELLPENHMMVRDVLGILQNAKFNIENTQIARELKRRWELVDETVRNRYFNSLQIIQSTFHKNKILGEEDLPSDRESVIKLLMDLPINPPIISILEGMGIIGPELPKKTLGVGYFYNIFTDSIMTNSPFAMDTLEYTDIGFRSARGIFAKLIAEKLVLNSVFDSDILYYRDRLKQLNIPEEFQFKVENFTSNPKEGYNIVPPKTKVTTLTGVREIRIFSIFLKKPLIQLSASYRVSISNLPQKFEPEKMGELDKWNAFFLGNGTHIVKSCYAGGSLEVVARKNNNSKKETSHEEVLSIIADILSKAGCFAPMDLSSRAEDWDFQIAFKGGDPNLIYPNLASLFNPIGVKFFKNWTASLNAHPVMLHSEIELENITNYLKRTNPTMAKEIVNAMYHLFCPQTPNQDGPSLSELDAATASLKLERPKSPNLNLKPLPSAQTVSHLRKPSTASSSSDSEAATPIKRNEIKAPVTQKPLGWGAWFAQAFKKPKQKN